MGHSPDEPTLQDRLLLLLMDNLTSKKQLKDYAIYSIFIGCEYEKINNRQQ